MSIAMQMIMAKMLLIMSSSRGAADSTPHITVMNGLLTMITIASLNASFSDSP